MPITCTRTLTAGPLTLTRVAADIGTVWSEERQDLPGAGAAVELAAVLQLLAAVDRGEVRAVEAMAAFGPFVEAAAAYDREAKELAARLEGQHQ